MSELCIYNPLHFSTLVISHIILFSSFILSHPLYFSYFIFFSPYLLKLFSFLSPLFVPFLVLLIAHYFESPRKCWVNHEEFRCCLDDFERVYEFFFGSENDDRSSSGGGGGGDRRVVEENRDCVDELGTSNCGEIGEENRVSVSKSGNNNCGEIKVENRVSVGKLENNSSGEMVEEKRMENFLKILDEFEKMSSNAQQIKQKIAPLSRAKIEKAVEKPNRDDKDELNSINGETETNSMVNSQSSQISKNNGNSRDFDSSFTSYGSMRKEKEWNRTLACKLFEERHNVDHGGEGMDSLWEAYEIDSDKTKAKSFDKIKNPKKNKNKKKKKMNEIEEEDEVVGQLCCLQTLKLSSGKMNMGMKRPNLVKITKAIKGFGWLHHVSKKVHNNGDKDRFF